MHDTFTCHITCKKARIWSYLWLVRHNTSDSVLFCSRDYNSCNLWNVTDSSSQPTLSRLRYAFSFLWAVIILQWNSSWYNYIKKAKRSFFKEIARVSGVSGGKGERWKWKGERAEGEKRLTQMLLLEPSTPKQHDSIPSNQNHFRSLGCQLQTASSVKKLA